MNSSSLDQNHQPNPKIEPKHHMKTKAPISLINNTQTIFIKNKLGNIASSYIDGSQKIQKTKKGNTVLISNCLNQPTAPIQSINNHIKNQTNILKTVQTSISSHHKPNQTNSTHSIVNSFTLKMTHLQLKDASSSLKAQKCKGSKKTNGDDDNNEKALCMKMINPSTNSHNVLQKMAFKNKNKNEKVKKSFVDNLDKMKAIKNRLNLNENKFQKVIAKIQANKSKKKTAELVSITLGKKANCTFRNHKCLNSIPGETTNITMPSKTNDSYNLAQTTNNLYCNTNEPKNDAEDDSKNNIPLSKKTEKEKDKNTQMRMKKVEKAIGSQISYRNAKNISVSINLGHDKQNTSSSIFKQTLTNDEPKEKENALKPKNNDTNENKNNAKQDRERTKAPKCPIKLNLLSLIQENKLKLKKGKEFNSSRCSYEDIVTILNTDPELLDTKRYKDFDHFDDVNSIVKKIHFEKVNKKSISIFSEDNTAYQLHSHKFNEKFTNKIQKYKNSEQRTNASGSTCENSSKKQFMLLPKCTLRNNNLQIEIP